MLYNGSNFYVAYTKTESSLDNVYYRKLEGSSWTEESLLADDVYDENRNYWTLAQDGQIWAIFTRYIQGTDDSQDVYARQYVGGQWQDEELWTDDHPTNIWPIDYASSIVSDTSGQVWGAYRKYTYSGDFPYHMKAKVIRRSINSTDKIETNLSLDSEGKASWAGPVLGVNSTGDKIYGIYGRVVTTAVEQTKEVESEDLLMKLQSAGSTTYWQDGPYRLTCSSMLKDTLSISRRFSPDGVVAIWNYRQDDNAVTYGNLTTHRHKASIEIADDGNPSDMLITLNIDIADPNEAQIYIAGDVIDDEQTFQWITIPPNSKIENIELNGLDGLKKIKAKFKDKFGNESPFYEIQYDLRLANPQVVNSTSDLRYKEGVYYFNSGNTYLINTPLVFNDSSFSVDSFAHKVVLEAGSIIKFGANAYIEIANDSSIDCIVAGEQYNYVLFTSAFDDSVGMDTDGIPSGDYENAILYRGKGDCLIEHAKFRYADTGIVIYNSTPDGESSNIEIRNSIFRDCKTGGVFLGSHPAYDSGTPTQVKNADIKVINNLFVDIAESLPRVGVTVNNSNANITIQNNTFHNIYTGDSNEGVCIYVEDAGTNTEIKYNIFHHSDVGIYVNSNPVNTIVDYNGYHDLSTEIIGSTCDNNPQYSSIPTIFTQNDNGSFYLVQDTDGFIDRGDITAEEIGLHTKTTNEPTYVTNDITVSTAWTKKQRDTGNLDLGYHYDPVDYIIKDSDGGDDPQIKVSGADIELRIFPRHRNCIFGLD